MYALGIDLGTTYTAAATWRAGHVEVASLGSRAAVIPSVVLVRDDQTFLIGDAANRRGLVEPHRLSREFKRRFGDTTPILLAGAPYSAEGLTATLLRAVVKAVAEREGESPTRLCVSHPANWGPYKKDLLQQAVRMAEVDVEVTLTSEPEAAAVCYAHQQRVEPGAVVAVYDLGGGTFDAAVLRKTGTGFEILGEPEGVERLGGIDFDAAVFAHVSRALGGKLAELDEDDPAVVAAVARLREECVAAKEALSGDTDTAIPVLLPDLTTEVRLTREELEEMVRPALYDSIEALRRALRSAGVTPEQLHSVLLVGGSSRMPIVAQLVGAELGRPVAVDAHPKHAVAMGAAWLASGTADPGAGPANGRTGAAGTAPGGTAPAGTAPAGTAPAGTAPAGVARASGAAAGLRRDTAVAGVASAATAPAPATPAPPPAATAAPHPASAPTVPAATASHPVPVPAQTAAAARPPTAPTPRPLRNPPSQPPTAPPARSPARRPPRAGARRWLPAAAGVGVVALLVAGGVALAQGGEDPPVDATPAAGDPPAEQCTDEIRANPSWVCLTAASFDPQGNLVVQYEAQFDGQTPSQSAGPHLHFYGGDGQGPDPQIMGRQALVLGLEPGRWYIEDRNPAVMPPDQVAEVIGAAPLVCARVAGPDHSLVLDVNGGYQTGNCVTIAR